MPMPRLRLAVGLAVCDAARLTAAGEGQAGPAGEGRPPLLIPELTPNFFADS